MKSLIIAVLCLVLVQAACGDIVYLKDGNVRAGTVKQIDVSSVTIILSDGQLLQIATEEIFRITDDQGKLLFDGSFQPAVKKPDITLQKPVPGPIEAEEPVLLQSSQEYRKVIHFPYWPLLGGTAILGYFGASQLTKSADTYDKSKELEALGLAFSDTRNQSQKERNWGQICIAGAAACLVGGLTPKIEKIPVQTALKVTPTGNGIQISYNF